MSENNHEYFRARIQSYQVDHNYRTRVKADMDLTAPLFKTTKRQSSFTFNVLKHGMTSFFA